MPKRPPTFVLTPESLAAAGARLRIDFREIFGLLRFSTFATISARSSRRLNPDEDLGRTRCGARRLGVLCDCPALEAAFRAASKAPPAWGSPFTGKPRMKNRTPDVRDCAALFGSGLWRSRLRMIDQLS